MASRTTILEELGIAPAWRLRRRPLGIVAERASEAAEDVGTGAAVRDAPNSRSRMYSSLMPTSRPGSGIVSRM